MSQQTTLNPKTKLLALDVGEARIGLAVGETGLSFAFGRGYLTRSQLQADIKAVQTFALQEGAELLVIGLPKHLSGQQSKQGQRVMAFAKALEEVGLSYVFEDERLSTKLASQQLSQSISKKKRQEKGRYDEAAAIIILESYLRRLKGI
ncbi:MAG: Holliday junction resolvase RuvX [Deinococcales bacterium]